MKTSSFQHRALVLTVALFISGFITAPITHAASAAPTPKPSIGGARPNIPGGDEGSTEDVARRAAFKKYQDCLTAGGVSLPDFGGRGFGPGKDGNNGVRPKGAPTNLPTARPTLSAAQQAVLNKCAALRPAFGRGGDGGRPVTLNPSAGSGIKKPAPPKSTKPAVSTMKPKAGAVTPSASYISCLNSNGVNVKTSAQIATLDKQSPKVAAALKKCAPKK